ncbi:hypothetical protein [Streptomyces sp. NPDC014622]|uniref:hypothetical protein n=1 Tax=Streptomyces sp. NPDC014622 TaxID=3364874 RepID=UPI0036FCB389
MTHRELLEKLVKAHGQWEKDREESFQEDLSTYEPIEGDQPCADWEMGDYDEIDENYAYDAGYTFISLADEARKLLEMESK